MPGSASTALLFASEQLNAEVAPLRFSPPTTHVYNPLVYARANYDLYVRRYANSGIRAVFVGMNPGPWGMAQTGIPFGDAAMVRDWLRLAEPIGQPGIAHPKRPVEGMSCRRTEVSGSRLWGAIRDHFATPAQFFANYFVANYCPLSFMEHSGRNRTPDRLPIAEREPLFAACDRHLRRLNQALRPQYVIGIGAFAETRARAALADAKIKIARIMHPSPANPAANAGWAQAVDQQLRQLDLCRDRVEQ